MALTHHRWDRRGRTFRTEQPNQFVWQGDIGNECTPDGLGGFLPYLLSSTTIKHGLDVSELELASDQQILRHAANVICSSFKIFVQANVAGTWTDQPHGVPTRAMHQNEVFRDGAWVADDSKCTGYLTFPDAHLSFGAQKPYDLQIGLEAGFGARAAIGIRLRSPVAGQMRLQIVLDGLAKIPATEWEWINQAGPPKGQGEVRHVGIRARDLEWRWSYAEAPLRSLSKTDNGDGTMAVTLTLGPYDIVKDVWLTVYPDTWGATAIQNDNDDGDCDGATWYPAGRWADGNLYLDDSQGGWVGVGLRWTPTLTETVTSIDAGTQIALVNPGGGSGETTVSGTLKAVESNTPAAWATTRPDQVANWTEATTAVTGSASSQNLACQTIINELKVTNSYTYSGTQYINLAIMITGTAGEGYWAATADLGSGTAATLAIVYTVAGGGPYTAADAGSMSMAGAAPTRRLDMWRTKTGAL